MADDEDVPSGTPCDWPVQACGELPDEGDEVYEPLRQAASEVLWALSGRQFGCCEVVVRPCRDECCVDCVLPLAGSWDSAAQWTPVLSNGVWTNVSCRRCRGCCSCPAVDEVALPGPVCSVVEVTVDGEIVDADAYRVDDYQWLVRTDGTKWPTCQSMGPALTEVGTWGVRFERGIAVPSGGQRALGEMMSELWKACRSDGSCCLPKRVQTITRQGLTMAMLDPMDFLEKGKTGLYWTDLWLQSVNPLARPEAARVLSPDSGDFRVTTWP